MKRLILLLTLIGFSAIADTPGPTSILGLKAGSCVGFVQGSAGSLFCNAGNSALNALLPNQSGNNGKFLSTDGTNSFWQSAVTSVPWGSITGTLSNQTDLQTALNGKEPSITAGTSSQYWRGDKTFQTLNTSVVPELTNLYFTNSRAQSAISASSPLTYSSGVVGCQTASGSQAGCLSSSDWTSFSNKQSALTFGNLTDVGTDGISITGGTGAVIGSGSAISQHVADSTHNGYLSSSDWTTFNNKQSTISLGAVGSSPNANAATFSSNVLTLQPFDASNPGVVTTGAQTFGGNKTFNASAIFNANIVYNSAALTITGANARISPHTNVVVDLTSASLTSIASASVAGVSDGHVIVVSNLTGNTITLVNNYGSALAGEAIFTGTGFDLTLPNKSSVILKYDSTSSAWLTLGETSPNLAAATGTLAIANGGTGQTTANAALNALLPSQTSNSGKFLTTDGTNTSWANTITSVAWGSITGTLSSQTDLQTALNGKEPTISAGTSSQYWRGDKTFQTLNTTAVPEGTNLYFTNARAQGAVSATAPIVDTAGVFSCNVASGSQAGCLSSTDWTTFNTGATGTIAISRGGTGQTTASAAFNALSPITTLGDLIYGSATNTASRLAGNTTSTKKFLTQTGTGSVSAAPSWGSIATGDLPTIPVSGGGTGATSFTAGSVIYMDGSSFTQDNSNFFYDGTNHRLGLGTTSPTYQLDTTKNVRFNGITIKRVVPSPYPGDNFSLIGDTNLNSITFGTNNLAIGSTVLTSVVGGGGNVGVGSFALNQLTSGSSNLAFGLAVLGNTTTGGDNVGIGSTVLASNISGRSNVGIGASALDGSTSGTPGANGSNNIAIGGHAGSAYYYDGASYLFGSNNLMIGANAFAAGFGDNNIAIGANAFAGDGNQSYAMVSNSIGIGTNAGFYNEYGTQNIFIGANSGYYSTGSYNTFIGPFTANALPFVTGAESNWTVITDGAANVRLYADDGGNAYIPGGALWQYAPAETAKSAAGTITAAQLKTQIISATGTTYTLTLDTSANLDAQFTGATMTNIGFDFYVINTASGTVTIALGTGQTSLGALTISAGSTGHFRLRRTAAATYKLYRL